MSELIVNETVSAAAPEVPVDGDYVLIIKVPFKAMDDVVAKQLAKGMTDDLDLGEVVDMKDRSIKLQRVFGTKPPIGISLT